MKGMAEKIKYNILILLSVFLLFFGGTMPAMAYDTAPRISDREIIESLAELKQGQKSLNQRFDSLDKRFESIDKRFESIDKRFEEMHNLILTLFASVMALVVAMIGYMIWDRKTAQQPFRDQLHHLENGVLNMEAEAQLGMKNPSGPVIERLLASLRKLAETDGKVAEVLRSFSLL